MKGNGTKKVFVDGAINPQFVADSIAKHAEKTGIGAHSIFLGQVRKDEINGKAVLAISYTAYNEMAAEKLMEIREDAFGKYSLNCMHIYHSLGEVLAGEISLFVFTSSKHRKEAMNACIYIVDRIKDELPVWGKEIFEDKSFTWKRNN